METIFRTWHVILVEQKGQHLSMCCFLLLTNTENCGSIFNGHDCYMHKSTGKPSVLQTLNQFKTQDVQSVQVATY